MAPSSLKIELWPMSGAEGGQEISPIGAQALKAEAAQRLEWPSASSSTSASSTSRKEALLPVLVQQPDGSLVHACPFGYEEPQAPRTPPEISEANEALAVDWRTVWRHARRLEAAAGKSREGLMAILLFSFVAEVLLSWSHLRGAARLQLLILQTHPHSAALHPSNPSMVAAVLLAHAVYDLAYYSLGLLAAGLHLRSFGCARRSSVIPRAQGGDFFFGDDRMLEVYSAWFARLALAGALVQPLLCVVAGHLSCAVMFLRLAAYGQANLYTADVRLAGSASRNLSLGAGQSRTRSSDPVAVGRRPQPMLGP